MPLPGLPVTGLQRRGATVLAGAVIVAALGVGVLAAPVPYVVLQPGPTVDTLGERDGVPVIEVDGQAGEESAGELRLTTVSVLPDINLVAAIRAWFSPDEAVVPEELFYPPDRSREEIEQENTAQFSQSQSAAETAAMRHLGYPVRVAVAEVVEDGPAAGQLQAEDVITAVDGVQIAAPEDLSGQITAHPVGSTLTIDYLRDGEPGSVEVTTAADEADPGTPRIGVFATEIVDHPYDLEIELDRIGGPSAGLMFALGIIDKLEPEDLTGGEIIAGTGSIDPAGNVGPIGGVPQKLVAARQAGAVAFLVPTANCAEAVANAQPELLLIEVGTLADALAGLDALRTGGPVNTCD